MAIELPVFIVMLVPKATVWAALIVSVEGLLIVIVAVFDVPVPASTPLTVPVKAQLLPIVRFPEIGGEQAETGLGKVKRKKAKVKSKTKK